MQFFIRFLQYCYVYISRNCSFTFACFESKVEIIFFLNWLNFMSEPSLKGCFRPIQHQVLIPQNPIISPKHPGQYIYTVYSQDIQENVHAIKYLRHLLGVKTLEPPYWSLHQPHLATPLNVWELKRPQLTR